MRGLPPGFAGEIRGVNISHWSFFRSVSYASLIIRGSPLDPFTLQPSFQTGSSGLFVFIVAFNPSLKMR